MKTANGVFLSRDYRLVVTPPKYDVPETKISGFFASVKDIKFLRVGYQINSPKRYFSLLFIVIFLTYKVTWTGTSNLQLTNLTLRRKVEVKKMKEQRTG